VIVKDALDRAIAEAQQSGGDTTAWDARLLLAHALGRRNPLALDVREALDPAAEGCFRELWDRRLAGVPVQHLVGEWDFFGRAFRVDERGLVPRPETETLVAVALREAPDARYILDAGTGSGILALTLLLERPAATAVALDASLAALALARSNAGRHGLAARIELLASDWLSPLKTVRFDLAVSNPPYLSLADEKELSATVREHDPHLALFAGADGLAAIRRLLDEIPAFLAPGAPFLFEIGFGQAAAVESEIRRRAAWSFQRIEPDLSGVPRVAVLRRSADSAPGA